MGELVFREKRSNAIFGTIGTGVFLLAGLATVIAGLVIASGDTKNADGGYVLVVIGGVPMLVFGYFFVQSARSIRAPGLLRLTDDGFGILRHSFTWDDVEDFHSVQTGGDSPTSYVQVVWSPSGRQHPSVMRSARLEKLGQSTLPTYIGVDRFDTGGVPLPEILRRWKQGDRTAGRPVAAAPTDRAATASTRTGPELMIPRKRADTIGALAFATPLFVGVAVGGPVLALTEHADHKPWEWIAAVTIWLLLTTFFGAGVYSLLRDLREPGLILTADGFEYERQHWAWSDIEDIRAAQGGSDGNAAFGIRAVFHADRPLPAAPSDLPFNRDSFAAGGPPIDTILREWLQRYNSRAQRGRQDRPSD